MGPGCVAFVYGCFKLKAGFDVSLMFPCTAKYPVQRLFAISPLKLRVSSSHTPSSPLERGNLHAINYLLLIRKQYLKTSLHNFPISNKKQASEPPLFERGRGCVTPAHSLLKSKTTTQSRQIPPRYTKHKKYHLAKQQQKSSLPSPRSLP